MNNKENAIKKLFDKYPDASALRKKNPEISDLLFGEFACELPNVYEFPTGIVVSKRLIQKAEKDPTVGIITSGIYRFDMKENREKMFVLEGSLIAKAGNGPLSLLQKYGSIMALAHTTLKLATFDDVFYICQYKPKK